MGCDIHMIAQVRKEGGWETLTSWPQPDYMREYDPKAKMVSLQRNYSLFAILANVRNGFGFAGIVTGSGFNPISDPKGIPDDCDEDEGELGDHSFSWLTVAELESFNWDQVTTKTGLVNSAERIWMLANKTESPDMWAGDAFGGMVEKVELSEMDRRIAENDYHPHLYARVQWEVVYRDEAEQFLTDVLPRLKAAGKPEDVRIVFGFDS